MDYGEIDKNEEKEKIAVEEKTKEELKQIIDRTDFGFTRIKTFEQLKTKVLEIKKDYEKTKIDVGDNTGNINIISNKIEDIMEGGDKEVEEAKNPTTSEGSKGNIKNQITEMNKKLKFLLGGISLEDIENNENNENGNGNEQDKKKLMNFEEINRRLTKLQFTKVDNVELDSKEEKIVNKIDDVERKMNELIYGLYGDYELHLNNDEQHTKITFVKQEDFDEYKKNTENEFGKICEEIDNLKRITDNIFDHLKEKASLKDLEDIKNYLLQKVEELFMGLSKKFVEKAEHAQALKNLEDQFKKIIVLLATKAEHENDNWLIAKKPVNGFSCAACESYIGELKDENNKYIPWNKMPLREREKEQEKEKEKIYRLGNGYSKVLKMVGVDNKGNVILNPTSNMEINSLFAGGNNENNKTKEVFDLQINRPGFERTQSAHSKDSKERTIDVIRTKNYRLPKIKGNMSTDNFDKIIENPNPNLSINQNNSSNNYISPKITKIMKKTQNRFNV